MIKPRVFAILAFLLALTANLFSATYYISNSGNDKNSGLSPVVPWQSISKLNSMMSKLRPGDAVLFERNGTFIGQINLFASGDDSNPLVIGAYGNGRNPVIKASIPLNNWSNHSGQIIESKADTIIKNVFVNGIQKTIARYPNSGLFTIQEAFRNANNGFIDRNIKQSNDFWKGSIARVRTINWAYEYSPVSNVSNGKITFSRPTYYPTQKGWGYYLDNNMNLLDTANEWFFKSNRVGGGSVYFIPPPGLILENSSIEGSVYSFGIYSSKNLNNIVIRDLNIRNQSESGIWLLGSNSKIRITNCTFSGQVKCGLSIVKKSSSVEIHNCRFYNINGKALYLLNCSGSSITNNVFRNIGMIPGYGTTGDALPMTAIVMLQCNSSRVAYNNIRNVGHDGINCLGSDNIIEKNVISNILLYLNDGGAIKSYGKKTENCEWKNNFASNVYGNLGGTDISSNYVSASGIYLDAYCNNIKVLNNTLSNCGMSGINLYDGCKNNLIEGNTSYGSPAGIRFYQEEIPMTGNSVVNNVFFGLSYNQVAVKLKARSSDFFPGNFSDNKYLNYYNNGLFQYEKGNILTEYNFLQWQELISPNIDNNSMVRSGNDLKFSKLYSNMTDDSITIILNPERYYKRLDFESIYGSLVLQPWSSEILSADSDLESLPELEIAGQGIDFGKLNGTVINEIKWFNLRGLSIKEEIIVKSPEGFEISLTEDANFTRDLYIFTEKVLTDKIIFVKFTPSIEKIYYDFITISSGNLVSRVRVDGNSR